MDAQILLVFRIGEYGQGRLAADILDGKPDRFLGELRFGQTMDFRQAAELFGGKSVYLDELKEHNFRTDQNVEEKAEVWYQFSDGSFGIVVCFTENWCGHYGDAAFVVENITGRIEYLGGKDNAYRFALNGKFLLGKYRADMALALSSGKKISSTVLSLKVEKAQAEVDLLNLIDSISGTGSYDSVPLPADYIRPEKAFGLDATLNLTERTFLLAGSYQMKPKTEAAIVIGFGMSDETAQEVAEPKTRSAWWIGAQLHNFTLSDISSALEGADRFLALDNVSAEVFLSNTEQEVPLQEDCFFSDGTGMVQVHKGLTFRINAQFCDSYLNDVLKLPSDCRIAGYIPKDQGEAIVLSGHIGDLVFLKFLTLKEIDITLYKEAKAENFLFKGEGNIELHFFELQIPKFHAAFSFEEDQTSERVTLSGAVGKALEKPLGIPNTKLEEVKFIAVSESLKREKTTEKRDSVSFQGQARIGKVQVGAAIYIAEKQPAVVELTIGKDQRISISGLVRQYCDFTWPNLLDIQLYNGRIWYCGKEVKIGQKEYQQGFHAQLDTKLFFLPEFTLSVDIGREDALVAEAWMKKAVELAFLRLYTKQGEREYGPKIAIQAGNDQGSFTLTTCITMFSADLGEVQIRVGKDRMHGTFSFGEKFPITGEVGFIADEKGFYLENCAIGNISVMDFKLPEMEFGKQKCKVRVLEEITFQTVPKVESKGFHIDDSMLEAAFDLTLCIKSESSFSGEGGDDFVELVFTGLALSADKNAFQEFTFQTFLEILGNNIVNLVQRTAEQVITGQIFDNVLTEEGMKNIVKFLSIAGLTWGINELVSFLVCEGLEKAMAEAFVAALTSVQVSSWEGLGYTLVLGGLLGALSADGSYTVEQKAPKGGEEEQQKNPQTPEAPTVCFQEEKLTIRWNVCKGAQGYSPIVQRNDEKGTAIELATGSTGDTALEIAGSDEESLYLASYGFTYQIKIYAWNHEGYAIGKETGIYLLKRPTNLTVRYLCEQKRLCITWDRVEKARQYEVTRRWQEHGAAKQKIVTYDADVCEAVYEKQEPSQVIEVFVRGKTEHVSGPAAASGRCFLYDLKPPEKIDGYDKEEGIFLAWTQVFYADRYRLLCLDEAGKEVEDAVYQETQAVINAKKLQENVCYHICIQPMNEVCVGWISEEVSVLWKRLPLPVIQEFVCDGDGIMSAVLAVDGIEYKQLVYPDGRVLALDEQALSCEWEIDGEAKVRLVDRARQGQWSDPVLALPVQPPEDAEAFVKEDILYVRWKEAEPSCLYGIEVMIGNDRRAEDVLTGTSWQTELLQMPPEEIIRISLYAIDPNDTRRRSVSVELGIRY